MIKQSLILAAVSMSILAGASIAPAQHADPNMNGYSNQQPTAGGGGVEMRQGRNFTYALPAGWIVGEEGPCALTLLTADRVSAGIIVYGNAGMLQQVSPQQYAAHVMTNALKLSDVQFLSARQIQPAPGCADAAAFEVSYTANGHRYRGVVTCNVAVGYAQSNATMTLCGALEQVWSQHASWLPRVAAQAVNSGGNAYGSTAIAQGNLQRSIDQGRQQADHRNWSANIQGQVQADRDRSWRMQNHYMGQMMTGNAWYANPYGGQPTYQSTYPAAQWMNPQGQIVTGDNPTFDPRTPYDNDWRRMEQQTPDE